MKRPEWDIHLVTNGAVCKECGSIEDNFIDNACDAHTHGLDQYGHLELQIVLNYTPHIICYILNTLGNNIRNGTRYKAGDKIEGLFADCPIRLDAAKDCEGVDILRVIIPDKFNRWPEDPACMVTYKHQILPLEQLYISGIIPS